MREWRPTQRAPPRHARLRGSHVEASGSVRTGFGGGLPIPTGSMRSAVFTAVLLLSGAMAAAEEALPRPASLEPAVRFWTLGHFGAMVAATILVRIGRVLAISAKTPADRRKWRFLFFALTTLAIIVGIPWPGLANARPLFRFW